MKQKPKSKAIHAELRKESKTFEGWLKYEITIQHPNGDTEQVPAYGKDLQDALSRVVHDQKVTNIENKIIKKIPETVWVFAWFLGMSLTVSLIYQYAEYKYAGLWIVGSILMYTLGSLSINNWFSLKNRDKR